jgi:hypothetical protein
MLISRDKIPAPPPWRGKPVEVPALGGEVEVRPMPLDLRLEAGAYADSQRPPDFSLRVLAASVLAGDGRPVYDVDGWARFNSQHSDQVLTLLGEITQLTNRGPEDVEKN